MAGLVQAGDGSFFGTTHGEFNGSGTLGTVFKIDSNGQLTNLVAFNRANGAYPEAALIRGVDGNFYGTTYGGGKNSYGTVFRMTPNGALTTLASFGNTNGGAPSARLLQDADGNLFGTTAAGGTNGGYGTVFRLATNGVLTTPVDFNGTNGARPFAGLVWGDDGSLYGTTRDGGLGTNQGTVFKVATNGQFTPLVAFNGVNGAQPYAELLKGSDGNFYGTTPRGGDNNLGTVFMMTPAGTLTTLVSFANTNGAQAYAGLIQAANGDFYGTTANGGAYGKGTVFHFQMPLFVSAVTSTRDALNIVWRALTGRTYQVQFCSDWNLNNWNNLGNAITATNSTMTVNDSTTLDTRRFYRVVQLQ